MSDPLLTPSPEPDRNDADGDLERLRDTLKRCSSATVEAACLYRRTGNVAHLGPVVRGVIERYVERDLRPRLAAGGDDVRLIEDLSIDSLTLMEIVVLTEDILRITVSNEELVQLRTVGDVHAFIVAKLHP